MRYARTPPVRFIRTHASMDTERLEKLRYLRAAVGTTAAGVAAHILYLKQPEERRQRAEQWLGTHLARRGVDPRQYNLPLPEGTLQPQPSPPSRPNVPGLPAPLLTSPIKDALIADSSDREAALLAAKARARAAGCSGWLAPLAWWRNASCAQLKAEVVSARLERDRPESQRGR